jgi:hypothetical protein
MQQLKKQPASDLGQIVATPGALAALWRLDRTRASSSRVMSAVSGAICPTKTKRKTTTA